MALECIRFGSIGFGMWVLCLMDWFEMGKGSCRGWGRVIGLGYVETLVRAGLESMGYWTVIWGVGVGMWGICVGFRECEVLVSDGFEVWEGLCLIWVCV